MKSILFAVALAGLSASAFAQETDTEPTYGTVSVVRKTILKTAPNPQAAAASTVAPGAELRWVMGERAGKYLRVIVPKGPMGWVLESDVRKLANAEVSFGSVSTPCVTPLSIDACTDQKPAGCSPPDSPHGLVNEIKRKVPSGQAPALLTFESFAQLQTAAQQLVDQGIDIPVDQRDQIKSIEIAEGTVGEGSLVRLVAFLSEGKPHANSGESVNCNLKGIPNNDFHISVTEAANGSEFEGVVVEMIPQNRPDSWSLKNLLKLKGKQLLIEGALFYDNLHVANADEGHPLNGQPKRFALWEIHPVTSLKVCKRAPCNPENPGEWRDL